VSAPRRVLPGETYLITRRCYQRTFRLRPSARTNQIFLYRLARAAQKTGVRIHAVCVMSNHHHLVVTDVRGELPVFLRELHRSTAKAINASQGQWENLWSAEQTSAVHLGDEDDILRKIAYVVANPVDAGLVAEPRDWPGLLLWEDHEVPVTRPDDYFDPLGESPERLALRIESPTRKGAAPRPVSAWRQRLATAIRDRVAAAHHAVRCAGLAFLGRNAVLAASFIARAKSYEVRRGLVPTVAAADPETRRTLLTIRVQFLGAYRTALELWRRGLRDVTFPIGTWWLRVHHGVAVATGDRGDAPLVPA
jgi:putative transposase